MLSYWLTKENCDSPYSVINIYIFPISLTISEDRLTISEDRITFCSKMPFYTHSHQTDEHVTNSPSPTILWGPSQIL